jgi:kynurenine formamidase
MRFKYLSYPLGEKIPVYGKLTKTKLRIVKSIACGDSSNAYEITIENHWGTHVDGPAHFFDNCKKIDKIEAKTWFFDKPQALTVKLKPSQILECGRWLESIDRKTDILLIKGGWSGFRANKKYYLQNPGIHPEVGRYIRKKFSSLRAIGIDWISVSAYQKRELGRQAHRAFLDPRGINHPLLLIEDMDLSASLKNLKRIFAFPVLIKGADSSPCTVIGEFR